MKNKQDKQKVKKINEADLGFTFDVIKEDVNKTSSKFKMFVETMRGSGGRIETVNLKSNIVKFSSILTTKSVKFKIVVIIIAAFIMSLITLFFIKNSGLYSTGINGIFQGISRLAKYGLIKENVNPQIIDIVYNTMFWTLSIVINVPLAIFAYKKVSKQFAVLTMLYVACAQLFGLGIGYIPGIDKIMIFGETSIDIQPNNIVSIESIQKLQDIPFIRWGQNNTLSLFIYCLIAGLLSGLVLVFILMVGSSTGGTDVFSVYFAKKKNKSIGFSLIIINNISLFSSTIIGSFGSMLLIDPTIVTSVIDEKNNISSVLQTLLSPNLIFSGIMAIISGIVVDILFPKSKFVQVKIYTKDVEKLQQSFLKYGYKHNFYINEVIEPFEGYKQSVIDTICMYIELPTLLSIIRYVDENSMISINKLSDVDGPMNVIK